MQPTNQYKVKICGITRIQDAIHACQAGAWGLGFIFWSNSPRYVEPLHVKGILHALAQQGLTPTLTVGVFVNAEISQIRATAALAGINTVQLHGEETPDFCRHLALPVIKAWRLKDETDLKLIATYHGTCDYLLVDSYCPHSAGGSGVQADWRLAAQIQGHSPLVLAGGITPDNIGEAMRQVKPFAIDLSSGVEESPGIKSHELITQLFSRLDKL